MSLLDSFTDYKIDVYPVVTTQAPDADGNWADTRTEGTLFKAVKYNRSDASRYFSQTWATNISDVLVIDFDSGLTNSDEVKIGTTYWKCDTPINVADQNEIWLIGLERKV